MGCWDGVVVVKYGNEGRGQVQGWGYGAFFLARGVYAGGMRCIVMASKGRLLYRTLGQGHVLWGARCQRAWRR